jgi:hypothetical protein
MSDEARGRVILRESRHDWDVGGGEVQEGWTAASKGWIVCREATIQGHREVELDRR